MTRQALAILALVPSLALATPAPVPRVAARLRALSRGVMAPSLRADRDGRITVTVWAPGAAASLAARGLDARAVTRDLAEVRLAPSELATLVALPGVVSVEPARVLRTQLDQSVPMTGATALRRDFGVDGSGAIVGVVDTGADFRHPDLRNADGTTRLVALLDVSHPDDGRHPELPGYGGAIWLAGEIDAQLDADARMETPAVPVTERDTDGHGTHVTGIAAGNGRATGHGLPAGRYIGMAPGALLVVAQASQGGGSFSDADILSSIRFVFDVADRVGMPAVVNLSLGAPDGPHDGTTNLERALDALVPLDQPGRAVAVAAGNDGSRDHHAGGWRLDGTVDVAILVPSDATAATSVAIDFWSDGAPRPVAFTLVAPDGARFGPVAAGDSHDFGTDSPQGHVVIGNAMPLDAADHRKDSYLEIDPVGKRVIQTGTWHLLVDGTVDRWDGWMEDVAAAAPSPRFVSHLDEDTTCDLPALASSAIAVGSLVSKDHWRTVDGTLIQRPIVVGQLSTFSGSGPSLDGRFLPDVVAPGEFITSSLSQDAPPSQTSSVFNVPGAQDYLWADDGVHGLLRGTSQATPHVTGAIAQLFQIDPSLTPRRLRELLRASADLDAGAPGYSPRGGFGRLDVARAAAILRRSPVAVVDAAASSVGVARDVVPPGDTPVRVSVVPRDRAGAPLGPGHAVSILSDIGDWDGAIVDGGEGRYERVLLPHAPLRSVATITAIVDGVPLASRPRVWLVDDRSDVGAPLVATGGCGVTGPATWRKHSAHICTILLLAVAAIGVGRRRWPSARRHRYTRPRKERP